MPSELLRVWYGNTTTPPNTRVNGSMYVVTGLGDGFANIFFDLGGSRYQLKAGGALDHTFTVGGVAFNGAADRSVNLYTYTLESGATNGTIKVTPYLNNAAQTPYEVAVQGLGTAAFRAATEFLGATDTATAAAKLTKNLYIYNNSNSAIAFGSDGNDKTVYIGSDIGVGDGALATAKTSAAITTNGNVYLMSLYQDNTAAWNVKSRLGITGANGVSVTADASGNITITGTTYTALPNPKTLTFNNSGSGAASGTTYNGAADRTISYNTIGAAAANTEITAASFGNDNKTLTLTKAAGNITVELPASAAINISGKATTAGTADQVGHTLTLQIGGTTKASFTGASDKTFNVTYADLGVIPLEYIPATARERLFVTALTATNNTDAKAIQAAITAESVQEGDVIQVNGTSGVTPAVTGDGAGKMYFIYKDGNTLTYREFTAGTASLALEASKVAHALSITVKQADATTGQDISISFNGAADRALTIPLASATNSGLISHLQQTIAGQKDFTAKITGTSAEFTGGVTASGGFVGNLTGTATNATTASQVGHGLTLTGAATGITNNSVSFTGLSDVTVGAFKAANAANAGMWGFVPTPPANSHQKLLAGGANWWSLLSGNGITVTVDTTNNTFTFNHSHSRITERTDLTGLSADRTYYAFGGSNTSFTVAHLKYDTDGHITGAENKTLTISPITYTPNSNFASDGYEFGTFSDGNSDHDFVIRGGIVWETFS